MLVTGLFFALVLQVNVAGIAASSRDEFDKGPANRIALRDNHNMPMIGVEV
jgi:hypothetical protein